VTDLKNAGSARFGEIDEGKTAVEARNGTRMIQFGVFEADLRAIDQSMRLGQAVNHVC